MVQNQLYVYVLGIFNIIVFVVKIIMCIMFFLKYSLLWLTVIFLDRTDD